MDIADQIEVRYEATSNGKPYTALGYERPGVWIGAIVGDIESFLMQIDDLMTFYPREVREMAAVLNHLADRMEDRPPRDELSDEEAYENRRGMRGPCDDDEVGE